MLLNKLYSTLNLNAENIIGFKINNTETLKDALRVRNKMAKKSIIVFCIVFFISIILAAFLRKENINIGVIILLIVLSEAFILGYWIDFSTRTYTEVILKSAINEILPNAQFNYNEHISVDELVSKRVVLPGNSTQGKIHIYDKTPGCEFEYSNLKIVKKSKSSSSNKTRTSVLFKGFIIKTKLSRNIEYSTRIITSNKSNLGEIIRFWPDKANNEQLIDVENILFNDNFEVYSYSQHDTFILLTSYVTEKILELKNRYSDFGIVICGNDMYIAVKTGKLPLDVPKIISEQDIEKIDLSKEVNNVKFLVSFAKDITSYFSGKL